MRVKQNKLTFFINSSCIAGNITGSLGRAESLLVHQLPTDRRGQWDGIPQAMWHAGAKRLKASVLKMDSQQLHQTNTHHFCLQIWIHDAPPKMQVTLKNTGYRTVSKAAPVTVQPLMDTQISVLSPKRKGRQRGHLRGIGACFICTCAIHVESNLLSLAATVVRIQSINGHLEFNLKNIRERQLITMAQPQTYQLQPNPTLSNISTGLQHI